MRHNYYFSIPEPKGDIIIENDDGLDLLLLQEKINEHQQSATRYTELKKLYEGKHPILEEPPAEIGKPDNRLITNFAKYIVDTLNGYFLGIPLKITHENDKIAEFIEYIGNINDLDNEQYEISKNCSIFGVAYEMLYLDEDGNIGITTLDPRNAFLMYDDSIRKRALYGVHYYKNADNVLMGTVSDKDSIYYFQENEKGDLVITETRPNPFGDIPIIEYIENEEKRSAFEPVISLITAYNQALSEKANDVDYYADAYLKIIGAEFTEEMKRDMREFRIINAFPEDPETNAKIDISFVGKPEADKTQENLIDRLEKKIFQISMVADINNENFGTTSGIALNYKLQNMNNLANNKERKFTSGLNKRYKMIARLPNNSMQEDDWIKLKYRFTRNTPKNVLEETQIAMNLQGIVSDETILNYLSIVDNTKEEQRRIEKEKESDLNSYGDWGLGNGDEETAESDLLSDQPTRSKGISGFNGAVSVNADKSQKGN